jgi:hypothetical protein
VDADGRFSFKDVPAGTHLVALDLTTVPASYDVGPHSSLSVDIEKRGTATSTFPLILLGKITGRVTTVDKSVATADGAVSAKEPGARLRVLLNGGKKVTVTDSDGEFEFTSLPAGEYRVQLDEASLPQFWTVASTHVLPTTLLPGGKVSGLAFVVDANPRARRVVLTTEQPPP